MVSLFCLESVIDYCLVFPFFPFSRRVNVSPALKSKTNDASNFYVLV